MDSSRVLLAVILSIILVVAYQELVLKRFFPPTQQQQQAEQAKAARLAQGNETGNGQATALPAPAAIGSPAATGQQSNSVTPSMALVPERTVEVDSDFYIATFTTRGARLKSFVLTRYRQSADKSAPPYEMVQVAPGGRLPLGAVMTREGNVVDDADFNYETNAPGKIKAATGARSTWRFVSCSMRRA